MEPIKKPMTDDLPRYLRRYGLPEIAVDHMSARLTAARPGPDDQDIEGAYDSLVAAWAAVRLDLRAATPGKAAAHLAALCEISGATARWPDAFLAETGDVDEATWQAFQKAVMEARRTVTALPRETPTVLPAPNLDVPSTQAVVEGVAARVRRIVDDLRHPASVNLR
ncbi:MAG: hypothetical protein IPI58_08995 [Alphaproteobacteria bacterium]|nr:MAG: hypothetical protein IPI58_08995 [Alphaproteobacteria bacterium]